MRVTFVLPFPYWTGGVRTVYEYSRRLRARGHAVDVVFPLVPYRFRVGRGGWRSARSWLAACRRNLLHGAHPPRPPVTWGVRMVPRIADRFLPDADVVVATAWPTAYSVSRLSERKGAGCYLIQHREIDSGTPERVDASYRLGLFHIAASRSTACEMAESRGVPIHAVAPGGVDAAFWGAPHGGEPRRGVLWSCSPIEHKGGEDGRAALEQVHRARPSARIRAFGFGRPPRLPSFIEYVERPRDETLRELYASAEIFLYSSRSEGFGLPPLEAQAAGCAVVSTRVGDVPEFVRHGANGLLVEPRDWQGLAHAVLSLLDQPERRQQLARAAAAGASAHGWERSTDAMEWALERAAGACAPMLAQGAR
jgi:glycosyltransferase involved in cell wall biosynthesis